MILVDSNVWYAYLDTNDHFHKQAVEVIESANKLVLPYAVLLEVATLLAYRISKTVADNFIMIAVNINEIMIIDNDTDKELFYFLNHKTKMSFADYSLSYLSSQYGFELRTFDKQLERFAKKNKAKVVTLL